MKRYLLIPALLLSVQAQAESTYPDLAETGPTRALQAGEVHHTPRDWKALPDGEFGESIKRGYSLFANSQQLHRSGQVNNGLNCINCHLGAGQLANAAPMWAAYVSYPAYRAKNKKVNTFEDRLQGCFMYSMNAGKGKAPGVLSQEILDLTAYSYWLSFGATVDNNLPGRSYAKMSHAPAEPDFVRGQRVYASECAVCHGKNGEGQQVDNRYVFPPLWGKDSYNWGAGMHQINTAANFIKANMPLGERYSLSDQQAWDVALFINSHERPQDPRFDGSVSQTAEAYHQHNDRYGKPSPVDRHLLGSQAF